MMSWNSLRQDTQLVWLWTISRNIQATRFVSWKLLFLFRLKYAQSYDGSHKLLNINVDFRQNANLILFSPLCGVTTDNWIHSFRQSISFLTPHYYYIRSYDWSFNIILNLLSKPHMAYIAVCCAPIWCRIPQ